MISTLRRFSIAALAAAILAFSSAAANAASAVYPLWKQEVIKGTAGTALTGTNTCALVDTGTYTYSAAHQFKSSLTGIVGTPGVLASMTFALGVVDAADLTYTAVTGASVEAIVCWIDTAGADSTDPLWLYVDGISVTPNGGNITIQWDNGANKIAAF